MSSVMFLALVAALTLTLYIFSLKWYWKKKGVRSFVMLSVMANIKLLAMQLSLGKFLYKLYNKPGTSLVGFYVCGTPSVLIKDRQLIKRILIKDFENFHHRTVGINYEGDPLGTKVLFSLRNPSWRLMRNKFSSSFTTGRMRAMYPAINTVGDNLVRYVKIHESIPLDVHETFHKFSTDAITSCVLGMDVNCFEDSGSISREIARKIFADDIWLGIQFMYYFLVPDLAKRLNMKFLDPSAGSFVQDVIAQIAEFRDKNNLRKDDFVGRIIEMDKRKIYVNDRSEIIAQAVQFWTAGVETVGLSLGLFLRELAHHPDVQDRLRDEICSTLKKNDGNISYDTIRGMIYLRMVTTELHRKYSVISFIDRACINDYQIPGTDITIDGGTNIYVSIQGLHYDPEIFPNPYKFDPERFHPDRTTENLPFFIFGDGPRHCIGLRFARTTVSVGLVKILSNFNVLPLDKYEDMKFNARTFFLAPRKPIYLKFEPV